MNGKNIYWLIIEYNEVFQILAWASTDWAIKESIKESVF